MLASCSGGVFILPGRLPVVLTNIIIVRFQTQKSKPNPKKNRRFGRFGPILGTVFLEVDFFQDRGNRNMPNPTIIETSQTP